MQACETLSSEIDLKPVDEPVGRRDSQNQQGIGERARVCSSEKSLNILCPQASHNFSGFLSLKRG